jgi:hypothetical protein
MIQVKLEGLAVFLASQVNNTEVQVSMSADGHEMVEKMVEGGAARFLLTQPLGGKPNDYAVRCMENGVTMGYLYHNWLLSQVRRLFIIEEHPTARSYEAAQRAMNEGFVPFIPQKPTSPEIEQANLIWVGLCTDMLRIGTGERVEKFVELAKRNGMRVEEEG